MATTYDHRTWAPTERALPPASTGQLPSIVSPLAGQVIVVVISGKAAVSLHREAARLIGAADAARESMGTVRFKTLETDFDSSAAMLGDAMGGKEFESTRVEGTALSIDEAIAHAQRGRGERKRPASGWASFTPAEHDVVRLVSEGLANKDIATRLSSHRAPCKPTSPTSTPNSA